MGPMDPEWNDAQLAPPPPVAVPPPNVTPPRPLGGGGPGIGDILALLGMALGSASSATGGRGNPMAAFGAHQMEQHAESQEIAKVGQAIAGARENPNALRELLGQVRSPRAAAMLDSAITRGETVADRKAIRDEAAATQRGMVNQVEALRGRTMPGEVTEIGSDGEAMPAPNVKRPLYQDELPGGSSKLYPPGMFPRNPAYAAAEKRAEKYAEIDPTVAGKRAEIPVKVEEQAAIVPGQNQQNIDQHLAKIGPDLNAFIVKHGITLSMDQKAELAKLVDPVRQQAVIDEKNKLETGTAAAKGAAANTVLAATSDQRVKTAGEIAAVSREDKAGDVATPAGGREYWDRKTREMVTLTNQQAKSLDYRKANNIQDVAGPEGASLRLIKGAVPQMDAADKLVTKLLSPAGGEQFLKAGKYALAKIAQTDPDVAQLSQSMKYLTLEGGRVIGGSVRVPVTMMKMLEGSMPTTRSSLAVARRELDNFRSDLNNRFNSVLGAPLEVIRTDEPDVTVGGLQLKQWRK
jgi:hypothetical protein